jgi:hypothetical protein
MWIDATIYYYDNFQVVKNNCRFNENEAAQEQFSCNEMDGEMAFIKANFSSLTEGIKCLQDKGFPRSGEKNSQ